ncbi:MAG: ATP-grasp domain-containing protein [Clostridia bacterium]|nr:ATP-grasp domain-containing protein [Clostridia bacterium]
MKNVAVFFGGQSVEHDVSIITGVLTANAIDKQKYNVYPIYVDEGGVWRYDQKVNLDVDALIKTDKNKLKRVTFIGGNNLLYEVKGKRLKPIGEIAVAINCMHGGEGENGSLAGLLNLCGVPLCSPNVLASSVCMDKRFTKIALKGMGVKTLQSLVVKSVEEIGENIEKVVFPAIVKPNLLGSSIGIAVAKDLSELKKAVAGALRYGSCVLIEPCLKDFIEINCSCYLDENGKVVVSECEKPVGKDAVLTFKDKYEKGDRVFPADIKESLSKKIKNLTEKIYLELDARGIIRIDFFISGGEVLVNEINTVPGSLAYYLHTKTIKEFSAVIDRLILLCEREFAEKCSCQTVFKSGILAGVGSKGTKHL